jgi:hypothetical protein
MERTEDPFANAFAHRENTKLVPETIEKLNKKYPSKGGSE